MLYVASGGAKGRPPDRRCRGFSSSGYYVLRSGWETSREPYSDHRYLVFDCGPLGAGNHGHLDLLSIEAAAFGRSLVVDPGRYTYDESGEVNWRVRFRGTGYHNTVLVDGKDQTCYVPGEKKYKIAGPPPDYDLCEFTSQAGFDFVHGIARSHEYDAVHERRIYFINGEYWFIVDELRAPRSHRYDLLFHLTEGALDRTDLRQEHGTWRVDAPHLVLAHDAAENGAPELDRGYVSYRYGERFAAPVVRYVQEAEDAVFHTVLYPYREHAPEITVRKLPVGPVSGAETTDAGHAYAITIENGAPAVTDICFAAPRGSSSPWSFSEYEYDGPYLFMRKDHRKRIVQLHVSEGAQLHAPGRHISTRETEV